ncbi:MAG TPA: MnhB domain-containing protein [Phycisphaerae bacterium]|nr:MnhB domain-containing protein [Phycisphaerae bacterium]
MTTGMTPIVKNTARLVSGFIAIFGIYIAMTGHVSPGGGFAGGVILAAAAVLVVLAFGRDTAEQIITESRCHIYDAAGAGLFLLVALCGYFTGGFFVNFIARHSVGEVGHLASGGTIIVSNLFIMVKVAAGLAGGFLALAAFRRANLPDGHPAEEL